MITIDEIKNKARELQNNLIIIRRYLHQNPELSFQEYNTANYIAEVLKSYGIPYKTGVAGTGVVAIIEGKNPGSKAIALRADIDALPIVEENTVEYKSKNTGVMHACGHDVHSTCVLGAAKILSGLKDNFEGTIKLLFQPGEEKLPGGASMMIKEGVLEQPYCSNVIGQHVLPTMPVGKVGFKSGLFMASADEIYVTVKGKGGHAAMPHLNIDPILIASNIIVSLQQIVSRYAPPHIPTVLSFGKIIGNGATNVIPDEVKIEGTFRTFNEKWRFEAHEKMKELATSIAKGMGGQCEFDIVVGYPFLTNDAGLTEDCKKLAIDYLGAENVEELEIRMTAEDFSFYTQERPSCFYRLGTGNISKGIIHNIHTSKFDIDEQALEIGSGLMAWLAINKLKA